MTFWHQISDINSQTTSLPWFYFTLSPKYLAGKQILPQKIQFSRVNLSPLCNVPSEFL